MTTITDAEREAALAAVYSAANRGKLYEFEAEVIDALLSLGWRPAPVVDDAMVERAAAAWSICSGTGFSWSEMSEKWRDGVRARVHNVLLAALNPET